MTGCSPGAELSHEGGGETLLLCDVRGGFSQPTGGGAGGAPKSKIFISRLGPDGHTAGSNCNAP